VRQTDRAPVGTGLELRLVYVIPQQKQVQKVVVCTQEKRVPLTDVLQKYVVHVEYLWRVIHRTIVTNSCGEKVINKSVIALFRARRDSWQSQFVSGATKRCASWRARNRTSHASQYLQS
jgi:hypothetical protein